MAMNVNLLSSSLLLFLYMVNVFKYNFPNQHTYSWTSCIVRNYRIHLAQLRQLQGNGFIKYGLSVLW